MRASLIIVLSSIVASLPAAAAGAAPVQAAADIRAAARALVREATGAAADPDTEIEVGRLDPRLRLPRCEQPLAAFLPASGKLGGNINVGVRCEGKKPWLLYVPITVRRYGEVAVVTRTHARGEPVAAGGIEYRRMRLGGVNGGYFTPEAPVPAGLTAARTLVPGQILKRSLLHRPTIIERGQMIKFIGDFGSIQVETRVRALGRAASGEPLRVEHLGSGRVMDAVAVSAGLARLPAPKQRLREPGVRAGPLADAKAGGPRAAKAH